MKFISKHIEISDEEFGCTITFSESENDIDSMDTEKYLLLQRTYPEDEYEEDYYYIESSDFDKSGELENFSIDLSASNFNLSTETDTYEINFELTTEKYELLKQTLTKLCNGNGQLNFKN
jgi:hypothetical protein